MCTVENLVIASTSLEISTGDSTNKYNCIVRQDNLVGIVTAYRMDIQGIRIWFTAGIIDFSLLYSDHTGSRSNQGSYQFWFWRPCISYEAEHSSLESATFMNACSYYSTLTYLFLVWWWIKDSECLLIMATHYDNFNLLLNHISYINLYSMCLM